VSIWGPKEIAAYEEGKYDERARLINLLRDLRQEAKDKNLSQTANINAIITLLQGDNINTLVSNIRRQA
jgi:hypothetical protein